MRTDALARITESCDWTKGLVPALGKQTFSVLNKHLYWSSRQKYSTEEDIQICNGSLYSPAVPASGIRDANPYKLPSTQPEHVRLESEFSSSSCSPDLQSSD